MTWVFIDELICFFLFISKSCTKPMSKQIPTYDFSKAQFNRHFDAIFFKIVSHPCSCPYIYIFIYFVNNLWNIITQLTKIFDTNAALCATCRASIRPSGNKVWNQRFHKNVLSPWSGRKVGWNRKPWVTISSRKRPLSQMNIVSNSEILTELDSIMNTNRQNSILASPSG